MLRVYEDSEFRGKALEFRSKQRDLDRFKLTEIRLLGRTLKTITFNNNISSLEVLPTFDDPTDPESIIEVGPDGLPFEAWFAFENKDFEGKVWGPFFLGNAYNFSSPFGFENDVISSLSVIKNKEATAQAIAVLGKRLRQGKLLEADKDRRDNYLGALARGDITESIRIQARTTSQIMTSAGETVADIQDLIIASSEATGEALEGAEAVVEGAGELARETGELIGDIEKEIAEDISEIDAEKLVDDVKDTVTDAVEDIKDFTKDLTSGQFGLMGLLGSMQNLPLIIIGAGLVMFIIFIIIMVFVFSQINKVTPEEKIALLNATKPIPTVTIPAPAPAPAPKGG